MTINKKVLTSINVKPEILAHAKANPQIKSFSDWINETYELQFLKLDIAIDRLNELVKQVEDQKEIIKAIKEVDARINIPDDAYTWIKNNAESRILKSTTKGVLNFFNNTFKLELTEKEFNRYRERIKNEKV